MPTIQTVLFDLDGTLIDSIQLIIDSYHHTLATHGIPPRTDAEWLAGIGTPLSAQFAAWAADEARMAQLIATYREYNLAQHDSRVRAYPGVIEVIGQLRTSGIVTGLVTSKNRHGALRGLGVCGLDGTMDVLVCSDEVDNPKPHPEPVLKALTHLDADPATTVYVGDSVHDMRSGRAAGVRTAAALWGPFDQPHLAPATPDYWLERPEDLLMLVDL